MPPVPGSSAIELSASLTARFAADIAPLWPGEGTLGLAVSGGPDSLALLLLAHAALPGRIAAATVDHGLRPANADEAAMVAALCARLGVPHATLPVTLAEGNVQAEARAARYAALAEWMGANGLTALATAHHADDQAETLLLRLNRGSGVAGLAGVRARGQVPGTRLPLVRPLLGWRRAELAQVVTAAALVAADDPSNRDDRFDRARLRKALAEAGWIDVPALAASAAHIADADAALDWAMVREWQDCVTRAPLAGLSPAGPARDCHQGHGPDHHRTGWRGPARQRRGAIVRKSGGAPARLDRQPGGPPPARRLELLARAGAAPGVTQRFRSVSPLA